MDIGPILRTFYVEPSLLPVPEVLRLEPVAQLELLRFTEFGHIREPRDLLST